MAITKDKKRDILAKLENALKGATAAVFVRFHKLTVADATTLRKALKSEQVGYYVAKKTLLKRALGNQGYAGDAPELAGEIALAWGAGDATLPPRLVHEFAKKFKGALEIVGGVFDSAFADAAKMTAIATIPSVPVLRGMFANIINSPRSRFAIALSEVAKTKS
jgi:large subunit ribosomal protein L10